MLWRRSRQMLPYYRHRHSSQHRCRLPRQRRTMHRLRWQQPMQRLIMHLYLSQRSAVYRLHHCRRLRLRPLGQLWRILRPASVTVCLQPRQRRPAHLVGYHRCRTLALCRHCRRRRSVLTKRACRRCRPHHRPLQRRLILPSSRFLVSNSLAAVY